MRYEGSDTGLMILKPDDGDFASAFVQRHRREFNFTSERPILIDYVRVRTIASANKISERSPLQQLKAAELMEASQPARYTHVYFESEFVKTPVYLLEGLGSGVKLQGPAIIIDETQTIAVATNASVKVLQTCVVIDLERAPRDVVLSPQVDPIRLTIFSHRFASVAEQMGRTLPKTAVSTNIKERLDFSCAYFRRMVGS